MRIQINKTGVDFLDIPSTLFPADRRYVGERKAEFFILRICPHCNAEIYGNWKVRRFWLEDSDRRGNKLPSPTPTTAKEVNSIIDLAAANIDKCRIEAEKFRELTFCPICNGNLSEEKGFFGQSGDSVFSINTMCAASSVKKQSLNGDKKALWDRESKEVNSIYKFWETCGLNFPPEKIDTASKILKKLRDSLDSEKVKALVSGKKELFDTPVQAIASSEKIKELNTTPEKLQDYIHTLIQLETEIYSLTIHLPTLYAQRIENDRQVLFSQNYPIYLERSKIDVEEESIQTIKNEIEEAQKHLELQKAALNREKQEVQNKLQDCQARLDAIQNGNITPFQSTITYPAEPQKPILKTPGIFNKSRTEKKNAELLAQYNLKLSQYQQKVAECDAQYEEQKQAYEKEQKRKEDALVFAVDFNLDKLKSVGKREEQCQKEFDTFKSEKEAIIAEKENVIAALETMLARPIVAPAATPAMAINTILDQEIAEAESLLQKLYQCRNELYSYDIVFGKYRDIVALSSFYEYLITGRCSSLQGPDGAYNLYESESRADVIISKLDQVVESLEQIKKNQYVIYTELTRIHSTLESLNSKMGQALSSIKEIKADTAQMSEYMERVAQNSDVIAHNTARTAYYAKVNSELTNALGYMVAFS